MEWLKRPVILLGNGARGCNVGRLLELGVPVLTSWQAKDLVDNEHPSYLGSPGIYGQRAANKVLHEADQVIAIGNRLAIWNVGSGIRKDQELIQVELDKDELRAGASSIFGDCKHIIGKLHKAECHDWYFQCLEWRYEYQFVEACHDDVGGYINSYRFMESLQFFLRRDEVIATDMGTAHICAHQVLRLKPPQRIISSGGLGEMGCGLPLAIGASFARNKGEVLCLVGDGGAMMNLQELATIVHHQLPIKIIVFRNDGYLMLKHTQRGAGVPLHGVDKATGLSCPSFMAIAKAWGIESDEIRTEDDFDRAIPALLSSKGPFLVEYHMHPEQPLVPKLGYRLIDGRKEYDRFDSMSPKEIHA